MKYYFSFLLFCIIFGNVFSNIPKNNKKIYSTKMFKYFKKSLDKQRNLKYTNINKKNKLFNINLKNDNISSIVSKIPEKTVPNINVNNNVNQNGNKTEIPASNYIKNQRRGKKLFSTEVIVGLVVVAVVLVFGSIILALVLRKYQNKSTAEDNANTVVKLQVNENANKVNNKV